MESPIFDNSSEATSVEPKIVSGHVKNANADLGSVLWDLLDAGKYQQAVEEIENDRNQSIILNTCMDIIPVLTLKLQDSSELAAVECIETLLTHVAKVAKVKEVIIVMLEEVHVLKAHEFFYVILKPLQVALSRHVSTKCNKTLFTWTFKSVLDHMAKMELPSGYNLEGKERKLLDADPCVVSLSDNLTYVLDFFNVFYQDIILAKLIFSNMKESTKIFMSKVLLSLFDKPLAYLDIYCVKKNDESTTYRSTLKLVSMTVRLYGNPISLLNDLEINSSSLSNACRSERDKEGGQDNESAEDDPSLVSLKSYATFYYCIFHQQMSIESIPCVYNPIFKFLKCLPLVCELLSQAEHLVLHKGLLLSKALVEGIDECSVPSDCLEAPCHYKFNTLLVSSMTIVDNKELRLIALNIFRRYVSNFDHVGRFKLFEMMLQSVTHAGVMGFIITEIKQNIFSSLQKENAKFKTGRDDCPSNIFIGLSMWKLVHLACKLPDGERTDMLDWSDKIFAALNLVLFVFMRAATIMTFDCTSEAVRETTEKSALQSHMKQSCATFKQSELLQHISHLEEEFFSPLQRGLQISREHYELKLKDLSSSLNSGVAVEVSVADSLLPGLSPEQEKDVVALALSRFDLINCVLARAQSAVEVVVVKCKQEPN